MKFEEQESIDDSSKETVLKPEIEENEAFEKIEPMLDYGNIKSSKDIEVPPLLIDQVIGHEESIETIKKQQNKGEIFYLSVILGLENQCLLKVWLRFYLMNP